MIVADQQARPRRKSHRRPPPVALLPSLLSPCGFTGSLRPDGLSLAVKHGPVGISPAGRQAKTLAASAQTALLFFVAMSSTCVTRVTAFSPPAGGLRVDERAKVAPRHRPPMGRISPAPNVLWPTQGLGRVGGGRAAAALRGNAGPGEKEGWDQQEPVVLLVGVGADEAATITALVREAGDGPFAAARVISLQQRHMTWLLGDVLRPEQDPGAGAQEEEAAKAAEADADVRCRAMLLFGAASIDEEAHEIFLDSMDQADNSMLMMPAVRNPELVVGDLVRDLVRGHDAAWALNTPVQTSPACSWDPRSVSVAMNLEIDGAFVKTRVAGVCVCVCVCVCV